MERLSIGQRIYGGFGAVLGLLAVLIVVSFGALLFIGDMFKEYRATAWQSIAVGDFSKELFDARELVPWRYAQT